jgi:hypothetical protein
MARGVKITSVDRGANAMIARLRKMAAGQNLTVGIHEAEGAQAAEGSDDATLIEIAAFNEFGGPPTESKPEGNPPRRSFIVDWADENVEENRAALRKSAAAVLKGTVPDMTTALNRVGLLFVGRIQARIKAGIEPANAESTIERKGSSTPLIDGGQMWKSVTHQVGNGSSGNSQ